VTIFNGRFSYAFEVNNPYLEFAPHPVVVDVRIAADGSFDGGTQYVADAPLLPYGWRWAWVYRGGPHRQCITRGRREQPELRAPSFPDLMRI